MGYSLYANFYVNKELKFTVWFDELKSLNERRYSASLNCDEVECSIPVPEGLSEYNSYQWFDIHSFAKKSEELLKQMEESIIRKAELEKMTKSVEYFKLTSEQKDDILSEISYAEETIKDCQWGFSACEKMIGIISILKEGYYSVNGKELEYSNESRDVKVLVYSN